MRKIRRSKLTGFIIIPLIFVLLTYLLIFTVFSPVLSPLFSAFKLFSTNESYSNTSQSIFLPNGQSGGSVSIKNISFPKYGMHYATIKLPESKGTSDIYFGDSDENLKKGVGQYIGSFLPGYGAPILIGGHNNTYFNGLKNIKKDDIITITTSYGTFKYKVTNTKVIVNPNNKAYDLSQKKEQLILYTCYPFNTLGLTSKRFFVYADKISGPQIVD